MKQISSLDLYFLTHEFKQKLENSRIETFYYEKGIFYIRLYTKKDANMYLTNKVSKYIYMTKEKDEMSEPKNFVQYLRKYLKNATLKTITQVENERIIKLELEYKDPETKEVRIYYLILELFANGNVILVDKDYTILNSLEKKKFKDRTVMVKDTYELPPQKELNLFNPKPDLLEKELKETDLSIVKFLAIKFGIGGKFAEEICELAKIDKNINAAELKKEQITEITEKLSKIINTPLHAYNVLDENDKIIDFIPFEFISIKNKKVENISFNEAIKNYYESEQEETTDQKEKEYEKELAKLINRLKKQENQKDEILIDYEKLNGIGNKIYDNFSLLEELLNQINTASKEKGWEHVQKTIKENPKLKKLIKTLNYKNNEIILELE